MTLTVRFANLNKFILGLIVVCANIEALCSNSASIQFDQIASLVKSNNQHVKGSTLMSQSTELGKGYFKRSFLPQIQAKLGIENFKAGERDIKTEPYGSISAKLNLYHGGRDLIQNRINEVRADAAAADTEITVREEILNARIDYWNLIWQREMILVLEESLKQNQKNLTSANTRIRAGVATETDQIEFEMHKLELEQDLARLRLASTNTERSLVVLLGLPEGSQLQTPARVEHDHNDDLLEKNFEPGKDPNVEQLVHRSKEAQLEAVQLGNWWQPTFDLVGNHSLYTFREREFEIQSQRIESVVGIELSFDLLDGAEKNNQKQQKSLTALGLLKESEQASREIQTKTAGAKAELKLMHDLVHKSEEVVNKSQNYLIRTLDEYRRGVKNSPDVLVAAERNLSSQRRFSELRRDYQIARSELLSALGK